MGDADLQGLLDDLYDQLRDEYDVDIGEWDAIAEHHSPRGVARRIG